MNSGSSYSGSTIFLDADLDFTGKTFEPIGTNFTRYFIGTFDGHGHVISNLKIKSTGPFVGLFGFSEGLIIRNTVIDSTCSIEIPSSSKSSIRIAGFAGRCYGNIGQCIAESSVNMASISYAGSVVNSDLCIGGISSEFISSSKFTSIIRNCVNYGAIIQTGKSTN